MDFYHIIYFGQFSWLLNILSIIFIHRQLYFYWQNRHILQFQSNLDQFTINCKCNHMVANLVFKVPGATTNTTVVLLSTFLTVKLHRMLLNDTKTSSFWWIGVNLHQVVPLGTNKSNLWSVDFGPKSMTLKIEDQYWAE